MRRSAERWCCLLIVGCALAIVGYRLGPALLGQRVFLGLDLFGQFLPWSRTQDIDTLTNFYVWDNLDFFTPAYAQIHERLLHGDLAVWSPYVGGGSPLLSLPIFGSFSPVRLPYLLLPTWLAPAWSKLIELAFASAGAYLLLRRLRASRAAALLAGLAYPLTGFLIAWANWPQTAVAAFIPALFWAVERFVQERRVRAAAPIAVVIAFLLFGGFPAVAGLACYAAGAYLVVRVLAERRGVRAGLRDVGVALGAVLVGVAATAVQLLPFVHGFLGVADLSYREDGFSRTEPVEYLLSTVLPASFAGNRLPIYDGPFNPIEVNTYLGSAVLVLAAVALLRRLAPGAPRAARGYFAGLALIAVLLVWAQFPPLTWLGHLPVFADNPIGRIRSVLCLAVVVLAAIGFDAVVRFARDEEHTAASVRRRVVESVVLVAGLAALTLACAWAASRLRGLSSDARQDAVLAVAAAAVVVVALVLAITARGWRPARWLPVLVIPLVVAAQAAVAVSFYWATGSRENFYATSSTHEFLTSHVGGDRVATTGLTLWPNTTAYYGIRTVSGHGFFPEPMKQLIQAIDPHSFGRPTSGVLSAANPSLLGSPGLDRLAARYYVTPASSRIPGERDRVGRPGRPFALSAPATATVPAGPLRAVGVTVGDDPAPPAGLATVTVTVADGTGTQLLTAQRRLPKLVPGRVELVPLAGEELPRSGGALTVTVTVEAVAPVSLVGQRDRPAGTPLLTVLRPGGGQAKLVHAADGLVVWERPTSMPRIRWASRSTVVSDAQQRLDAVVGGTVPADTVVLDRAAGPADGRPAEVEVLEDGGDTIRVRVRAQGAGFLVVADNIQTDWTATVDGTPVEITPAEYAVGAVAVPAGEHQVELRYAPRGRTLGTVLSLTAGGLLVVVAVPPRVWRRIRSRRSTDPEAEQ